MSSGAGRGRGWLNLAKGAEPLKPLGLAKHITNELTPVAYTSQYPELIEKIKEFGKSDLGMICRKGLKVSKTKRREMRTKLLEIPIWSQACSSREEVERSVEDVYKNCLHDTNLGSSFIWMISYQIDNVNVVHAGLVRGLFLRKLQTDFESINQLQTTSPLLFRNYVHMFAETYKTFTIHRVLGGPFIACLELLLCNKSLPDLVLYTQQLFVNGLDLKNNSNEGISKLSIRTRTILAEETQLVKESKLLLMLALEFFNNQFSVLESEVYKFYEDHLGSAAMIHFQKPHDNLSDLSIETIHSSNVLDNYQSNVNVLQISTSPTEISSDEIRNLNLSESNCANNRDSSNKNEEKTGRPILGAGARFVKTKSDESNCYKWTDKKPPALKNKKGWEHDDRFDNDYNY